MRTARKSTPYEAVGLIAVFILLFAQGCATLGDKKSEDHLRGRVEAYWQARMKGDIEGQYQLEEVAATKEATLLQYSKKKPVAEILGYQIEDIQINPEKTEAVVRLSVDYKWMLAGIPRKEITSSSTENWVYMNGDWYRKQRKMLQRNKN